MKCLFSYSRFITWVKFHFLSQEGQHVEILENLFYSKELETFKIQLLELL